MKSEGRGMWWVLLVLRRIVRRENGWGKFEGGSRND
jgi:hypothetical protein